MLPSAWTENDTSSSGSPSIGWLRPMYRTTPMTTATMAMRAMMPTTKPEPFSFGFLIFWLTDHTIAARVAQVTPGG